MAEMIWMSFGMWIQVGPRKHISMGCPLAPPGEYNWTTDMRRCHGLCQISLTTCYYYQQYCLQCFDTVGSASGRASGL